MRMKFMVLVGTALVAVLAFSGVVWAAANPLAVTKTTPNSEATEVAPTVNIKAYFNHDMRASTVTSSTFKIREKGTTTWLEATRSVNNRISPTSTNGGSQSVATLNPNANLALNTTYQVVVVGGRSGVKDVNGEALSTNKIWTFTTATPPETTIDSGPEGTIASGSASFSFSSSKLGSSFECSLDEAPFEPCTSPISVPDEGSLADGQHNFRVRALSAAGNADPTPDSYTWTVDTVAPAAPTVSLAIDSNSGLKTDNITNDTTPTIGGTAEASCTVKIYNANNQVVASVTAGNDGTWRYTFGALSDGSHTFTVKATDAAGNEGSGSSLTLVNDTQAPAKPGLPDLAAADDSGVSNTDNLTNVATPRISGMAEAGSTVSIFVGGQLLTSVQANGDGNWSYTFSAALQDGTYSVTVKATDAAENTSAESDALSLTIDGTAPNAPSKIDLIATSDTGSSSTDNITSDNTPTLDVTAEADSKVEIYNNTARQTVLGDAFASTAVVGDNANKVARVTSSELVDGTYEITATATDAAGNVSQGSSISLTIDTAAPETTLGDKPASPQNSASATFTFSSSESGSSFECSLDSGTFASCTSPKSYSGLADGSHTFTVRAIDAAGNTDSIPASHTWTVEATPPNTTIDTKPNNPSNNASPSFSFSSTEAGSTFECKLDTGAYASCTSPHSLSSLADGSHTFSVRAKDAAGNADPTPDTWTWTVDTTGPNASITDGPPSQFNSLTASFTFSGAEPGGGYVCRIDKLQPVSSEGTWSNCSSSESFTVETDGTYVLWVYAYDAAGNYGTAASRYWTVDTTAPTVNNDVSPANTATAVAPSANVTATFSEAMISSSISDQTFTLVRHNADGSRTPVEATVSYNSSTKQATLNPRSDLASNTTYTATIKGGSNGVKDWSGNTLVEDYSWTFTIATHVVVTPSPLDFTPGSSACNTTITKTVTITNPNASQVDLFPSVTNPHYSVASDVLHIASGESLSLSVSWTAPSSGFRIRDPGRLLLKDADGNIMGAGELTAVINCGIEG